MYIPTKLKKKQLKQIKDYLNWLVGISNSLKNNSIDFVIGGIDQVWNAVLKNTNSIDFIVGDQKKGLEKIVKKYENFMGDFNIDSFSEWLSEELLMAQALFKKIEEEDYLNSHSPKIKNPFGMKLKGEYFEYSNQYLLPSFENLGVLDLIAVRVLKDES